jgi:hypothetical protein
MTNNLTYTQVGDYLLPNLTSNSDNTTEHKTLGKYGRMRKTYLQQQRPALYNQMLLTGTLYPHLWEVDEAASSQTKQLIAALLAKNPAPNKETNQMGWVQHMNALKAQAEELVLTELIYN